MISIALHINDNIYSKLLHSQMISFALDINNNKYNKILHS